jgi:hypothetical protein
MLDPIEWLIVFISFLLFDPMGEIMLTAMFITSISLLIAFSFYFLYQLQEMRESFITLNEQIRKCNDNLIGKENPQE